MKRYELSKGNLGKLETIILKDNQSKVVVEILPALGNNLFRMVWNGVEIINGPEEFQKQNLHVESTKFGFPILFPPNRIKGASFHFNGKNYYFPKNLGDHHIHGELSSRKWRVIKSSTEEDKGAFVTSEFRIVDHPDIYQYFPFNMKFTLTYTVFQGELVVKGTLMNMEEHDVPFALGFHPYFYIPPLFEDDMTITIPVESEWPIDENGFVSDTPRDTNLCQFIREGINVSKIKPRRGYYLFTLPSLCSDSITCSIFNKKTKMKLKFKVDQKFLYIALFRPIWSNSVSLEPYTTITNCFGIPPHFKGFLKAPIHLGPCEKFEFECLVSLGLT